jgi:hypothetical protein
MWTRQINGRKNRVALELNQVPATRKMSLLIDDRVICETDFKNRDERKWILMNWEEKYSLFEKEYCISIAG